MTARQRISARDYKHGNGRSRGIDLSQYRQFGMGLAVGLAVALGVWIHFLRAMPVDAAEEASPRPRVAVEELAEPGAPEEESAEQYDFYDMLPKFEVVVSEQERDVRRDQPSVPVVQQGAYVVQAGSYRNQAEATRMRDRLVKLGIDAGIQKVTVDEDVWFRVRIGPFRDLDKLNATRRALRAADVDAIMYRVGD